METKTFIKQIKNLIANGELKKALENLLQFLKDSPLFDEIVQQSARLKSIQKQIRLGKVSHEETTVTLNQITDGLLASINEIETQDGNTEIQKEIEQAIIKIENSKNVVVSSKIIAKKVHIGDTTNIYNTYGDKKIPVALTSNPFLPEVFLGRKKELKAIHDKLFASDDNLLLLVNGQGGVGKTSIASRYYHDYQHEYAHFAWVLSEKSIANALLLLKVPLQLEFDPKMDISEQLQVLFSALANLDKPCLLVIDNANELEDLEIHYQKLRSLNKFHLLLTSRISAFKQAAYHRIEGLPEAEALNLFKQYYPLFKTEETQLFSQIYTAVGGNTLVVEVLAKNLSVFNNRLKTRYALANLVADLQEKGLFQLSQTDTISTDYQSKDGQMRHETPEKILAAMYDLGDVSEEEKKLLSVFAVLPAENISFEILESLLPSKVKNLDKILLSLAQKGWLEYNEKVGSFKCSPVVQEVLRQKNEDLQQDCEGLVDTLLEKLDYEGAEGHLLNATYEEALLYARYAETLVYAFDVPDYNLGILCERIGSYYETTGSLQKALIFYEKCNQLNRTLHSGTPENADFKNGLAASYQNLGQMHASLGNLQKALEYYESFTQLLKELHSSYSTNADFKNGLAASYSKQGETYALLGKLEKALEYYESFTQLLKELHSSYPMNVSFKNGLAVSYGKLGETHFSLGNLAKALDYYEECTRLGKELYSNYPANVSFKNGLAISYGKLGETHFSLGNLAKALEYYEERFRLGKELYNSYPTNVSFKNGLAISCENLGKMHFSLGNLAMALDYYEEETDLFEELYSSYPTNVSFKNGLAISYEKLGQIHFSLGNLAKALDYYEECTRLEKELYSSYPMNVSFKNGLAISYSKLGQTHASLGNLAKALEYYEKDMQLTKELYSSYPTNVSFKNGVAISYEKMGQTHASLGNLAKALEYYEERSRLGKELYSNYPTNVSFKNGLAISYIQLGWFYGAKLKNTKRAQEYYHLSKILLIELVDSFPAYVEFKQNLEWVENKLKD